MQCPVYDVRLAVTDRQGVEIDHCPRCRGVWLDRGELDKLIDRAGGRSWRDRHEDDEGSLRGGGGLGRGREGGRRRRRGGFLDDLFDFD